MTRLLLFLVPDSAVESIIFHEFLILLTQVLDALANPAVSTWLNASHAVIPVNCQIGAEAAKDLNIKGGPTFKTS